MGKKEKNQEKLLRMLRCHGSLNINEVMRALTLSEASVRRYFAEMEQSGQAVRFHGGIRMPATPTVASGATTELPTTLMPFGVKADISWASGTTAKATVSSTGVITGVATGTSTITATAGGKTASCVVTVTSE